MTGGLVTSHSIVKPDTGLFRVPANHMSSGSSIGSGNSRGKSGQKNRRSKKRVQPRPPAQALIGEQKNGMDQGNLKIHTKEALIRKISPQSLRDLGIQVSKSTTGTSTYNIRSKKSTSNSKSSKEIEMNNQKKIAPIQIVRATATNIDNRSKERVAGKIVSVEDMYRSNSQRRIRNTSQTNGVAPVAPGKKGIRRQLGSVDPPVIHDSKNTEMRHERRGSGNVMVESMRGHGKNMSNEHLK